MNDISEDIKEIGAPDLSSPLSKALVVLDAVAAADSPPRFVDLLTILPLSRATLHRQLRQLVSENMLIYNEVKQTYRIGMRVLRLAHSAWSRSSLASVAQEALDDLNQQVPETLHLAVLDGNQVLYLDKRLPPRSVRMFSSPGKVGPAYCTGVGKAMLAKLPEARLNTAISSQSFKRYTDKTLTSPQMLRDEIVRVQARGYALDDEEHEESIICLAVAIENRAGEPIGALSVTSTTFVTSLEGLVERYLVHLKTTAHVIAERAQVAMGL